MPIDPNWRPAAIGLPIGIAVILLGWWLFRFRSRRDISLTCTGCASPIVARPKITLLGQRKVRCSSCSRVNVYPMSKRYLAIYLVFFIGGILGLVAKLAEQPELREQVAAGNVFVFFGGLGMLCLVALTRDMLLRIRLGGRPEPAAQRPASEPVTQAATPGAMAQPHRSGVELWVWSVVILACLASVAVVVIALRAGWKTL